MKAKKLLIQLKERSVIKSKAPDMNYEVLMAALNKGWQISRIKFDSISGPVPWEPGFGVILVWTNGADTIVPVSYGRKISDFLMKNYGDIEIDVADEVIFQIENPPGAGAMSNRQSAM